MGSGRWCKCLFDHLKLKQLQLPEMSSIIDEEVFFPLQTSPPHCTPDDLLVLSQNICKVMKWKDEPFLVVENGSHFQAALKVETTGYTHLIQLSALRSGSTTRVIALLLDGSAYYRLPSQQQETILKRELLKRQKDCPPEASFCVHQRRVTLVLNNFLVSSSSHPQRMAQIYIRFIAKNLAHFAEVLKKTLRMQRVRRVERERSEVEEQLVVSCALSTIQSNVDISCDRSQYKFAVREIQKQSHQIQSIQSNIITERAIHKNIQNLYSFIQDSLTTQHLQENLVPSYRKNIKGFSKLLQLVNPIEKKTEDYLHSIVTVSHEEKQVDRHILEGGTSLIFRFKAAITFVNQQRVDKQLIIKMLRPNAKAAKMQHEKAIVSQLSNSVSHFIPKYYSVEDQNSFKNCLIMEMIRGEQLDAFISRQASLSFWSRLYIVLNVVQGVRHLIQQGIVHLDLKPPNILVGPQLITKIIDYGQSYHRDVCPPDYVPGYTFPYAAPQVISQILSRKQPFEYSEKQDAFAFGLILSEVFFNNRIFEMSNRTYKEVYSGGRQMERFLMCPQNLEAFGDEMFMSTLLVVVDRCLGQQERRPRFEWMNIMMRLIQDSYFNTY